MGPECEDPLDLDVNLKIIQLSGEGTVGATGSRIQPHCQLPPLEGLNAAADKGPQKVRTHQPNLFQFLNDLTQGL
jgi:hypothetical protein